MNKLKIAKYSVYKDSTVDWIGKIPEYWEIKPGFTVVEERSEKNLGLIEKVVLSLSYGKVKIKLEEKLTGLVPESFETYQLVYPGDIIIRPTDLQNDKTSLRTGLAKYKGIITSAYINLRVKNLYSTSFYHYFLHAVDITKVIYGLGTGLRQNLGFSEFKRFKFIVPPQDEQTDIANFLDCKTALIDQAIGIKQKQIELLKERRQILIHKAVTRGLNPQVKLKPSGVEWIGDIPEDWDKSHLKWISKLFAGGTPDKTNLKYWENGTIPWIASGEVNQEIVKLPTTYITNSGFRNSSARWIEKDSLIVALAGQGKTKGMVAYLDISTTGNQSLAAVIPNKIRMYTKYLFYYLIAAYKELRGVSGEGQRDGLNLQKLGDFDICIPSIEDQINISRFLEVVSKKTSDTISLKEKEIEKLKEYKATLINSAVTGKIKVC